MALIEVSNLSKTFTVVKKKAGLAAAVKSLFISEKEEVRAVEDISFSINKGEIVGYIGPNGSGKSTTIKMMSGILKPTAGKVLINGTDPQKDRKKVVGDLGVVFGQRTQLYWDLRLGESFELLKRIYRIPGETYESNMKMMDTLLGIGELIDKPVRQLSLGQRMRGDLVAAILHSPSVLFLDEPTIGLDIDAKQAIRKFIKDINKRRETTVILTTHDLDDIKELCDRIIIINEGKIIEDGSLDSLIGKIAPVRRMIVDFYDDPGDYTHGRAKIVNKSGTRLCFEFQKNEISAAELFSDIGKLYHIRDITLEEADIEDIIKTIYHR